MGVDGKEGARRPCPTYFDFKSADYIAKDRIGTVLRDVNAAKAEATVAAAEWIKDHACVEGTELCLSVRNGSRKLLFLS